MNKQSAISNQPSALDTMLLKSIDETSDIEKIIGSMYKRGQITRKGAEFAAAELAKLRDNYKASQELLAIREEQIGEFLEEIARLRDAQHLLGQYGFVVTFSGEHGHNYLRCRFCDGVNESETSHELNRNNVVHEEWCKLAAALNESETS